MQFCVCCSFNFVVICSLSDKTVRTVSSVCGNGAECFVFSRVSMRLFISGVKLGLSTLRLPRGICFLPVLVIMELNCAVIVLYVVSVKLVVLSFPALFLL